MTKPQQDERKRRRRVRRWDVKRRPEGKPDAVVWRQVLTLDADFVQGNLWAGVEMLFDRACCIYSTHKHSPDNPRLRLVIPLSRPVTPDEYPAIGRRVAADLGIDMFDDTTYEPHRLHVLAQYAWLTVSMCSTSRMSPGWIRTRFWPRYPDWKDPSYWPESSRVQQDRKKLPTNRGILLKKPGVVGAFCRTYSIEAIETFPQ